MNRYFRIAAIILLSVCLVASAGCVAKPQEEPENEWTGKEELTAPEDDPELESRYIDYKEKAAAAFTTVPTAPENDFEIREIEGGVAITSYVGSDNLVVIPDSIGNAAVIAIDENCFAEKNIRALYVPDSVKTLAKGALAKLDSLVTLRIPFVGDGGEATHLGYVFGIDSYEKHATGIPSSLDMVIVGGGDKIAENAFAGCKSISAVVIPESVKSIEKFAFFECSDLVFINTKEVNTVGSYAFGYCSSLYSLDLSAADSIGLGALYGASGINSLTLSIIGGSSTENRYLGYVFGAESPDHNGEYVSDSLRSLTISGNVPDRALTGCKYITSITFNEGIESIGIRAFYACRSLKTVTLPNSLKTISDDAFFGCDALASVTFGSGLESIGKQAFFGCRSLESISIPSGVTELKNGTFALCSSLKTVELNNVSTLGKDVFYGCIFSPETDGN